MDPSRWRRVTGRIRPRARSSGRPGTARYTRRWDVASHDLLGDPADRLDPHLDPRQAQTTAPRGVPAPNVHRATERTYRSQGPAACRPVTRPVPPLAVPSGAMTAAP